MLEDMQSHSLTPSDYWTDNRCRIPDKADWKKKKGGDGDVDSHTVITLVLEGRHPQRQIPPVTHYNNF